ncbi:MAG: phage shock protein PspC (stress-responsive transcriptional regulator) [Vicingaceae bacterium]|jgi:phage shock protein PspC (stress-responsive transcriptional regulator)
MNKTVTANISGVVFHIEADAYEKLHQYLNTIKNYFRDSDGTDEIMADIEARIAELFKERLGLGRDVITMENVKQVVEIMGEPEAYMDEESSENYESTSKGFYSDERNQSQQTSFSSRKLYRDEDDNALGGVCSGLGYYFGIDRIWIRIGFLIALFGFGTGFFLYLILWAIIPKAKTTSERLEMKGEPINAENIGNTIKDEFNNFKKKVDSKDARNFVKKTESAAMRFFIFLGNVLKFFFKFLSKILGVAFILASIAGIVTLIVFVFSGPFDMTINNANFNHFWTTDIAQLYFTSKSMFYMGLIGIVMVVVVPLAGTLYLGARLLFDVPNSNKAINLSAISLLVLGTIFISISATTTAADYSIEQRKTETINLTELKSDTIILKSIGTTYSAYKGGVEDVFIENDEIFMDEITVDVVKSRSVGFELRLKKSAEGKSRKLAGSRAENIMVEFEVEENILSISPLISVPFADRVRDQSVQVSIGLPIGATIYLSESTNDIIYDIDNETNMHDRNMIGHYWKMTEDGLICTDCVRSDYRKSRVPTRFTGQEADSFSDLKALVGLEKLIELKKLEGLSKLEQLEKLSEQEQLKELKKLVRLFDSKEIEELDLKIKSNGSEININL